MHDDFDQWTVLIGHDTVIPVSLFNLKKKKKTLSDQILDLI